LAQPPITILGAGPVGLVAALHARQLGLAVKVLTNRLPTAEDPCRLEVIPAQMIALLVEFGVHPRVLGVEQTYVKRLTQWNTQEVTASVAPPSAHVSRPALNLALLGLAERNGVIFQSVGNSSAKFISAGGGADAIVFDATGRSAVGALHVARPKVPLVSRTFHQPSGDQSRLDGFAIAAGPDGYAYRLSNSQQVTLGVVGHGNLVRGSAENVCACIRTFAPWILTGLDHDGLESGSAGASTLQWCKVAREGFRPIGDAHIARDALASQGLAIGFSDALRAISAVAQKKPADSVDSMSQLVQHKNTVGDLIADSPFASSPGWGRYLAFLRE
jgi:flavin-dependent dehydrogenase